MTFADNLPKIIPKQREYEKDVEVKSPNKEYQDDNRKWESTKEKRKQKEQIEKNTKTV